MFPNFKTELMMIEEMAAKFEVILNLHRMAIVEECERFFLL